MYSLGMSEAGAVCGSLPSVVHARGNASQKSGGGGDHLVGDAHTGGPPFQMVASNGGAGGWVGLGRQSNGGGGVGRTGVRGVPRTKAPPQSDLGIQIKAPPLPRDVPAVALAYGVSPKMKKKKKKKKKIDTNKRRRERRRRRRRRRRRVRGG